MSGDKRGQLYHPSTVVDTVSCRQLSLHSSYTFIRKETIPQKTKMCLEKVRERMAKDGKRRGKYGRRRRRRMTRRFATVKTMKKICCKAWCGVFERMLSLCTSSVVDYES